MDLDTLRQVAEEFIPFNKYLGVKAAHVEHGKVRLQVPWRDEFVGDPVKPAMHGGVISAVADAAGGMAIWSTVENASARVSTIDLRIDYLRPGRLSMIVAEGTAVRVGGRIGVADIRVFHADRPDETIATGRLFMRSGFPNMPGKSEGPALLLTLG